MSTIEARPSQTRASELPSPRGPLSESVLEYVTGRSARLWNQRGEAPLDDPDAQLALWLLHGLEVAFDWAVRPDRLRTLPLQQLHLHLSRSFEAEVQRMVPDARAVDLGRHLDQLSRTTAIDLVGTAATHGPDAVRDVFVSGAPHLIFGTDAHTMALARLEAPLQRIVAEIQLGAYGAPEQTLAQVYRRGLTALGCSCADAVTSAPTAALALANLAWLFGRDVRWRGAAVGQLCLLELDSPATCDALADEWDRAGLPAAARRWYEVRSRVGDAHVQIVCERLLPALRSQTPWLVADAAFGADATWALQQRLAAELVGRWRT